MLNFYFRSIISSLVTCLLSVLCLWSGCRQENPGHTIQPQTVSVDQRWVSLIGDSVSIKSALLDSFYRQDKILMHIVATAILNVLDSTQEKKAIRDYLLDTQRIRLRDSVELVFKNMDWQKSLGSPLARYQKSFPQQSIPSLHTLISDFNYGLFIYPDEEGKNAIAIGKEMFMGAYSLYDQLSITNPNFSSYINRTFNTAHLPSKIMYALANDAVLSPAGNRLLDHILAEGKKLYFLKSWMPETADTLLFEYTADQWTWVQENELDIWRFLIMDRLMYKTSSRDIANLTQPAPHSQGMPDAAPGRAVNYIGYRIIDAFMKKAKWDDETVAISQDYDRILKEAKYRPR